MPDKSTHDQIFTKRNFRALAKREREQQAAGSQLMLGSAINDQIVQGLGLALLLANRGPMFVANMLAQTVEQPEPPELAPQPKPEEPEATAEVAPEPEPEVLSEGDQQQ